MRIPRGEVFRTALACFRFAPGSCSLAVGPTTMPLPCVMRDPIAIPEECAEMQLQLHNMETEEIDPVFTCSASAHPAQAP